MADARKRNSKPGPGRPFPKGVSGNPGGRPKLGTSWAEAVRAVGKMSVAEISKRIKESNWKDLTAREAAVIKSYMALMNDPSGHMFNALADRADGKLPTPVAVGGDDNLGPIRIQVEYVDGEEAQALLRAGHGEG